MNYTFTIDVRVFNPDYLREVAMAHPDAFCTGLDALRNDDGTVDIEACLVMLLDPGMLAGCKILGSSAEQNEV